MIKIKMTVSEVVTVVDNFIKYYIAFEQRTNDRYELERVIPKITNQTAVAALQKRLITLSKKKTPLGSTTSCLFNSLLSIFSITISVKVCL